MSSNSTTASHPPPVSPPDGHVYPPVANPAPVTHEDEPSSECLLCLSSPREVVLLPCRHLVACRECAVNMIEFGAGGTITHADSEPAAPAAPEPVAEPAGPAEPTPEPEAEAGVAPAAEDGTPAAASTPAPVHTPADDSQPPPSSDANAPQPVPVMPPMNMNQRRKRKAKGWFCPVCRQRTYRLVFPASI